MTVSQVSSLADEALRICAAGPPALLPVRYANRP